MHIALSAAALGALLGLPALLMAPDSYTAFAAGAQAFGVIVALGLGALTLRNDSRDRQVDRVLALHAEYTDPVFSQARRRLRRHLRVHGTDGYVRRTTNHELRKDPVLASYGTLYPGELPAADARRILRFFERANAVRVAGAVHEQLFHELVGRHAAWWAEVFHDDEHRPPSEGLLDTAQWANDFAPSDRLYSSPWGMNRDEDFGPRPSPATNQSSR